jgi:hypothetical protein
MAVAPQMPLLPPDQTGLAQSCHRHLDQPLHFGLCHAKGWPLHGQTEHRVQEVSTDGDGKWRQPAQNLHERRLDSHFLLRLAERRILYGLTRLDAPARQRYLPGVMAQLRPAYREWHVPRAVVRIDEQQRRRRAKIANRIRRQPGPWTRSHSKLRVEPGQRPGQCPP